MASMCATLEERSAIATLFFDSDCVNNLATYEDPCPADDVFAFLGVFATENQMHVQTFSVLVIFVLLAGSQLGGVPRPGSFVPTLAFTLWVLTTILQWLVAILSFVLLVFSYQAMTRRYGACLVPFTEAQPGGLKRINMVAAGSLLFQPVLSSKLILLVMQPLALIAGLNGVERSLKLAGPVLALFSHVTLGVCYAYLSVVGVSAAIGYFATLCVWVGSGSFALSPVFFALTAVPLVTAIVITGILNGVGALASRVGVWRGRKRRESARKQQQAPAAYRNEVPMEYRNEVGAEAVDVEFSASFREGTAAPRRGRCARMAESVHAFMGFYFYWCEFGELRRVDELLQLSKIGVAFLCGFPLLLLLTLRLLQHGAQALWLLLRYVFLTCSGHPAGRWDELLRGTCLSGSIAALTRRVRAPTHPDFAAASNHLFAIVFISAVFVNCLSPVVVYDLWTSVVLYAPQPRPLGQSNRFIRVVYEFAFEGYGTFRIPALLELASIDFTSLARAFEAGFMSRWRDLRPSELLAGSRQLAALSVALGLIKVLALLVLSALLLLTCCKLKGSLDVLPLGVTARMSAAVDPAVFGREVCDLRHRLFSRFEIGAMANNQLAFNHVVRTLLLDGVSFDDDSIEKIARVLPSMARLRDLRLGTQPQLSAAGVRAVAKAAGAVNSLEWVELNGLTLLLGARQIPVLDLSVSPRNLRALPGGSTASGRSPSPPAEAPPPLRSWRWRSQGAGQSARESAGESAVLPLNERTVEVMTQLDALHCVLLAGLLSAHSLQPVVLRMGGQPIGDEGAVALAPALVHTSGLVELSLPRAGLRALAARVLAEEGSLPSLSKLTILELSGNELGAGVAPLLLALRPLAQLRTLKLAGCGMAPEFAASLSRLPPGLTELDLSANPLGANGAAHLAARLRELPSLASLELADCSLGDAGVTLLAAHLSGMPSLSTLDLRAHAAGVRGMRALAAALPSVAKLACLRLGSFSFDDDCALPIAEALRALTRIPKWAGKIALRAADAGVLSGAALPRLGTLAVLDLTPNSLSLDGVLSLAPALRLSASLESFRLESAWLDVQAMKVAEDVSLPPGLCASELLLSVELLASNGALVSLALGPSAQLRSELRTHITDWWGRRHDGDMAGLRLPPLASGAEEGGKALLAEGPLAVAMPAFRWMLSRGVSRRPVVRQTTPLTHAESGAGARRTSACHEVLVSARQPPPMPPRATQRPPPSPLTMAGQPSQAPARSPASTEAGSAHAAARPPVAAPSAEPPSKLDHVGGAEASLPPQSVPAQPSNVYALSY
mmetsp:Transcript_18648/g.43462  ORF Transcript_18648/g.43462 Transcript_18648/m.43462 type:complete len:1295 (-) Transcript_18648:440-4324(-)